MSNYWLDLEKIGNEPKKKKVPKGPMKTNNPWFSGPDAFNRFVQRENRKLAARWTREANEDLRAWHNLDAAQILSDQIAREIQREIDEEIVCQMRSQAQCRRTTH